ncbi:ABC transporter substrate-binding protein [Bacillus altitudinis]|uniref:ABC transporter substrate-binding protein n=1 Tax=Bacillus altitudinis TaxID=293387 RepID=UPI0029A54FBF|nr:ABC transporter substrate-binding protein [Bacillus altitudinis]MDX2364346.1 ABC transporter substrate-binding protein [Bacillus altitudinis]
MNRSIKVRLAFIFVVLLFIPFVACKKDQEQTVQVAEVTHSVFYAPLYVALSEGFFKDEGLEVELKTTWGGDKTMTALLSGGADIALTGSESSIYVEAQDTKDSVMNFAQLTQTDGTFLVSREKINQFSWDQLKGKDFLGQRKGGMPQMVGEYVLKKEGIDLKQDLRMIQNIDFANISGAFSSGTGDFVQLFEPTASLIEKGGKGYITASFGEASGKVPYTTFMAKKSYLEENKETAEAFTRAIYKAQKWVKAKSPEEITKTIQSQFPDTDLDVLSTAIKRYKQQNSYATDPLLNEEEWNKLQEIMKASGELPEFIPYKQLVDSSIAKKVTDHK